MTIENMLLNKYKDFAATDTKRTIIVDDMVDVLMASNNSVIYNSPRYKTFLCSGEFREPNRFRISLYNEYKSEDKMLKDIVYEIYEFYEFLLKKGFKTKDIAETIGASPQALLQWSMSSKKKLAIMFLYKKYIKEFDNGKNFSR